MSQSPWLSRLHSQPERHGDQRSGFQRDKARILHSAAFRRLQAKTQVLGVGMNDFHRTRLTHSLEAAQIGTGIASLLQQKFPQLADELDLNDSLIEALCLAHDIGHPPFGHGGEVALNYMMREYGGFEGNGQTFRILTKLELYTADAGMNLCRRTLLGLVKYPGLLSELQAPSQPGKEPTPPKLKDWIPAKGLFDDDKEVFDWLLQPLSENDRTLFTTAVHQPDVHAKTRYKSFDCSIMELADDIAYSIHDLEDAIVTGIVTKEKFIRLVYEPIKALNLDGLSPAMYQLTEQLFSDRHYHRKDAIGALVNRFITATEIDRSDEHFEEPLLQYNAVLPQPFADALGLFKQFVYEQVIQSYEVQVMEFKGQQLVMALFAAFSADPMRLLPENTQARWIDAEKHRQGMRIIADYIAGMTDEFASRLYNQLFLPKSSSGQSLNGFTY
ncbi:anti-phage deoxyguanosine triphosphatase [Lacimicrobium alkaliphilum]|uniref:Deoxyguanosinetriphosphate triphosphohydrolase-like protein n=1 Tax=Lacimicrobium alkaliphilum TaxID=1526571 RepID=A0ABQ1R1M8_9ALTE|nr:anti-phage deoxyguanosine triphosphatase [Lacimicrobium alkaliphilum]GGD53187.1 deoxyguanosinetriphosphate triphosphohydrolase-like protein [Lacimicrobium alkaliphilum]